MDCKHNWGTSTADRTMLAIAAVLAVAAGPTAADRAPGTAAMPQVAAAVAAEAIPGFKMTAGVLDRQSRLEAREAQFRPEVQSIIVVEEPFGPPARALRFGDGLVAELGLHVAAARLPPFDPFQTSVPGVAGGRLMTAGLATPSGGATHLGDAPILTRARRPTGTITPPIAAATETGSLPEPGMWAMLLAGVLGAGAIVRRRASL